MKQFLYGIHPVLSALCFKQRKIKQLIIREDWLENRMNKGLAYSWISRIHSIAQNSGVPVSFASMAAMGTLINGRAHQGVLLEADDITVEPISRRSISNFLSFYSFTNPECSQDFIRIRNRPVALLIDHLTDVMNLGSILRSAVFFGTSAVIFSTAPCVAPSPLISKLSAGAMESLSLFRFTDTVDDLKILSEAGFLVIGTMGLDSSLSSDNRCRTSFSLTAEEVGAYDDGGTGITPRPLVLALGSEARGLSPEVVKACDILLRIPGSQETCSDPVVPVLAYPSSLNVAVATGILLYQLANLRYPAETL
ncbi:unnamed protein product [Calicophoron daubneyi]|uniref:rRNA methyltransferase 1, mitochondrial n=1 Tax=Calicophoron daubneyi TaxID=300641 RepID=A0AAV2T187_CALDB